MPVSLFQKYGGLDSIASVVYDFHKRISKNPIVSPYFKGFDMGRIIEHQIEFFSEILGGPLKYTGRDMETAHLQLRITDEAFTEITKLLEETLSTHQFEPEDIITLIQKMNTLKPLIVG